MVAYIMTVTDFGWEDALHTVRAGRSCANPNLGFQKQLQESVHISVELSLLAPGGKDTYAQVPDKQGMLSPFSLLQPHSHAESQLVTVPR